MHARLDALNLALKVEEGHTGSGFALCDVQLVPNGINAAQAMTCEFVYSGEESVTGVKLNGAAFPGAASNRVLWSVKGPFTKGGQRTFTAISPLSTEAASAVKRGKAYFLLMTAEHPGGWVRGQLVPRDMIALTFSEDALTSPPKSQGSTAHALVTYQKVPAAGSDTEEKLVINIVHTVRDALGVHLHGPRYITGGYKKYFSPEPPNGCTPTRGVTTLSTNQQQLASMNGELYLDILSQTNANGELQVNINRIASHWAVLTGDYELPESSGINDIGIVIFYLYNSSTNANLKRRLHVRWNLSGDAKGVGGASVFVTFICVLSVLRKQRSQSICTFTHALRRCICTVAARMKTRLGPSLCCP
jgi:hypothetical protein